MKYDNNPGDIINYNGVRLIACLGENSSLDCERCYLKDTSGCVDFNCFSAPDLTGSENGLFYTLAD